MIGRIYGMDIIYSQRIHDKHRDLPFLPNNTVPVRFKSSEIYGYVRA
jgi:hypothetical protein